MDQPLKLRTLIIEDSDDDTVLLLNTLRKNGFESTHVRVDTGERLREALTAKWDIVFSDYTMPSFNGHEALKIVREHDPDVPFFFISGTIGEDRAVEAIRLGAQDYFLKGNLKRLPSAIHRELRDAENRREHRRAEQRVHYLANFDPLTGLPNRSRFTERLTQLIADGSHPLIGVFIFNLHRFKDVNDHLGTAAGDKLLVELAARLRMLSRDSDVIARLSADEFAIIAPEITEPDQVGTVAERLLSAVMQPFRLSRYEWRIHASMGSTLFPSDGLDCAELMSNATMALHHAQHTASDRWLPYSQQMRMQLQKKLTLQHALEGALEQQQFELYYQPQMRTADHKVVGLEALMRWRKTDGSFISAGDFIPMAEESGLIVPLGQWALNEACRQLRAWHDSGLARLRVAVNFSAYQFRQRDLVKTVSDALHHHDVPPSCIEVEITETALMQDAAAAQKILSELRDLGLSIALDDFGTGYSSLSYLKRFPVTLLKIDRAFVAELPDDDDDCAIVHAIIAMAGKLGMDVIAEGVENTEQLAFLREAGCDMAQGFYLQRPAPAGEIASLLRQGLNLH